MNLHRLFQRDLRCGLFRIRYLAVPLIFSLPCLWLSSALYNLGLTGSWMDYALYCFKGMEFLNHVSAISQIQLPIMWLLVIGGALVINLDYFLQDLSQSGLQIMYRCNSKHIWFLSKCLWIISSCMLYFLLAGLTISTFVVVTNGNYDFHNTAEITMGIFNLAEPVQLSSWQSIVVAVILPYLTITALSMVQMVLCLVIKPILSLLICISLLVVSVYWDTPFVLGNGAMAIRSGFVDPDGLNWSIEISIAIFVIVCCTIIGMWKFKHTDILIRED